MAKFFNSSIVDFNTKIGWGNSETTLDINLADCTVEGDSFDPPVIGSPVDFVYESFNFYGFTDTYKQDSSASGYPVYSVQLNNGLHVFGGVELVLNDYYGSVYGVPNLLNVFGHLENTGGFGDSGVNSAGMSWSVIASTVATLVNNISGSTYGAPISYKGKKFKVDLSNLPNIPAYYRINSDNISLIDFVSDVCTAGGHDFFVRLNKPTSGELAAGWSGTFEVVTVSRIDEPVPGKVDDFINSVECVSSKNYGQETRKDAHSKFVVGANVERLYFNYPQDSGDNSFDGGEISALEYGNDTVLPYFGEDYNGNVIIGYTPQGDPSEYYFNIDIIGVDTPLGESTYLTCLSELRAAKKGRDSWQRYLDERNCNQYVIVPTGAYLTTFFTASFTDYAGYASLPFYSGNMPTIGHVDYIPKFGYSWLIQKKGLAYANTIYTTTAARRLAYPNNHTINPYFMRADKLKMVGGWEVAFTRMFESDLYTKSTSNAYLATAYQEFKQKLGIDDWATTHYEAKKGKLQSKTEDVDLGNLTENVGNQIFKRIKNLADNYYNTKFMVSIPFTLGAYEPESFNIRMSQEVINEGFLDESAWPTAYSAGLIPDISGINTLLTPENKFYPFVKYENCVILDTGTNEITYSKYDFSNISDSDKIFNTPVASGGSLIYDCWVKCNTSEKIVFQDNQTLYRPRAVIELPGSVRDADEPYPMRIKALLTGFAQYAKNPGGVFYADTGVNNEFFQKRLDKIGGDDSIFHDGEDIVYANLYAIPLRSKLLSYGPWYAIGASGKVTYERNLDLNPWNYGGFNAMNNAANARVNDGITFQTFGENGSVTVPGSPTIALGDNLIAGGPYITDINTSFGSNGVTTTYNFQTWSSHRSLSKLNSYNTDRINRLSKVSRELRSTYRTSVKTGRVKGAGDFYNQLKGRLIDLNEYGRKDRPSTSHRVIAGEFNGASATVVMQPHYNTGAQMNTDYENKAFMSLDGLFRPFSTVPHSGLPYFNEPTTSGILGPTSLTLNPLDSGHDIQTITSGSGLAPYGLNTIHPTELLISSGERFINYRGIGFKQPSIGVGWGVNQNGIPVPNSGDEEYISGHMYKSNEWKAGPFNFMYDEDLGMWGSNQLQMGLAGADIATSSGIFDPTFGTIYRYHPNYIGNTGEIISQSTGYVFDTSVGPIASGTLIYYYNIYGKNHIIYAGCSPDARGVTLIANYSGV